MMKPKATIALLSAFAALCLGCSEAPSSSSGLSSAPASSVSASSSQSSSTQRALAPGYFHDGGGHWREYEGDATHEKVSYAPHEFGEWKESDGVLRRECGICGYAEAHEHTFPEGYEHDESAHWREADCGHSAREDYGPHEWSLSYDAEGDAIVYVHTCAVCGYQTRESTYDPEFLDAIEYVVDGDEVKVTWINDYMHADVINYPRFVEGKAVTSIAPKAIGLMNSKLTNENKAVVFVPSSVKTMRGFLADKTEIDLFYEGTLEDWLNLDVFLLAKSRLNLHLLDENGSYYLLKDVVLPAGTTELRSCAFAYQTIETFRCNDELKSVGPLCFNGCRYLKEVALNDGLSSLDLTAFTNSGIEKLRIPSSVDSLTQSLVAPHLYELVIEEGASADIAANSFRQCKRLVRLLDYRKSKTSSLEYFQNKIATAGQEEQITLHRDQGYVILKTDEGYSLLDYRGHERHIDIPPFFVVEGEKVNAYSLNKCMFHGLVLSGSSEISEEEYCNALQDHMVFEATLSESVVSCEEGTFRGGEIVNGLQCVYFAMGKQAMLDRIHDDPLAPYAPEFYYLGNGGYVRYVAQS